MNGSSSMYEPLTSTQCSLCTTSPLSLRSSYDWSCSDSSTPTRRMFALRALMSLRAVTLR